MDRRFFGQREWVVYRNFSSVQDSTIEPVEEEFAAVSWPETDHHIVAADFVGEIDVDEEG